MVIAIDGTVSSGKSTIAKKLAEHLGFLYCNTGAIYRAITIASKMPSKINILIFKFFFILPPIFSYILSYQFCLFFPSF